MVRTPPFHGGNLGSNPGRDALYIMQIDLTKIRSLAESAFEGHFRRGGEPAIKHSEAVVARVKGDESAEAVAWLHDVLEDTDVTAEDLLWSGVPVEVVTTVELLTHPRWEPYKTYLERVKVDPLATKVKVADMLTNLSDTPTERQIKKYAKGLLYLLDN